MSIKLVIADDHTMFVEALRNLLERSEEFKVIASTDNGDDLLHLIRQHKPNVALVDLSMQGPGARGIAKSVKKLRNETKLLALTMHLEPAMARLLIEDGFSGYVIKDAAFEELLGAIREVVDGGTFLSSAILRQEDNASTGNSDLTPRERECLQLAAEGLSNKLIAAQLDISERTVKYHFENILRKLNASRRGEAVAKGRRRNLI